MTALPMTGGGSPPSNGGGFLPSNGGDSPPSNGGENVGEIGGILPHHIGGEFSPSNGRGVSPITLGGGCGGNRESLWENRENDGKRNVRKWRVSSHQMGEGGFPIKWGGM